MSGFRKFRQRFLWGPYSSLLTALPDRLALSIESLRRTGRWPNLDHPKTFTEKQLALKIATPNPEYSRIADKVVAKEIVAEILGPEWVIPTIWHGAQLPMRSERNWTPPYVLKANHTSGGNIFVFDQERLNWDDIEKKTDKWLRTDYGVSQRSYHYSSIPRQLLVEPFIGSENELPVDYKFYVFNGRVEFVEVDTDRGHVHKRCFYDRAWTKQPFTIQYPLETRDVPPPIALDRMIWGAEQLGHPFGFLRVDFYENGAQPLFGEMTVFPDNGLGRFDPPFYDEILGKLMP